MDWLDVLALELCPYCTGAPTLVELKSGYSIHCFNFKCEKAPHTKTYHSKKKAINKWNKMKFK